ncbi:MAG TPA: hypothetical protein VG899_14745 [Mycobacteriales bacterium]|nr:hypothetical protein [Mycobacteriales bacterium]
MADSVQLTDLDVIAKYSIAVRTATADRDELIAALRADLSWLEHGRSRSSTAFRAPAQADDDASTSRTSTVSRPVAKKTTAKRAAARRDPS